MTVCLDRVELTLLGQKRLRSVTIAHLINQMVNQIIKPTGLLATAIVNNPTVSSIISEMLMMQITPPRQIPLQQVVQQESPDRAMAPVAMDLTPSDTKTPQEEKLLQEYQEVHDFKLWIQGQPTPNLEIPSIPESDPEIHEITPSMRVNEEERRVRFIIPRKSLNRSGDSITLRSPLNGLHKDPAKAIKEGPQVVKYTESALKLSDDPLERAKQAIERSKFNETLSVHVLQDSTLSKALAAAEATSIEALGTQLDTQVSISHPRL